MPVEYEGSSFYIELTLGEYFERDIAKDIEALSSTINIEVKVISSESNDFIFEGFDET